MKFEVKKLIRDKVVDIIAVSGRKPVSRQLGTEEFIIELKKKIAEESNEIGSIETEVLGELADLQELIDTLLEQLKVPREELERIMNDKREKAGGFENKIFLETVELQPESEWVDYYRKKGFKQIT